MHAARVSCGTFRTIALRAMNPENQSREPENEGATTLLLAFFEISVFLLMRWIAFLIFFTAPLAGFGQDASLDSLPQAVRETIEIEKGDGVATKAEPYTWGSVTIYIVEIEFDKVPTLELQIAENGKLLRVDRLQPEKESDDDGPDN
jgi:hypothetical protein